MLQEIKIIDSIYSLDNFYFLFKLNVINIIKKKQKKNLVSMAKRLLNHKVLYNRSNLI